MRNDLEQQVQFCTISDGTSIAYMLLGRGPALVVPIRLSTVIETCPAAASKAAR